MATITDLSAVRGADARVRVTIDGIVAGTVRAADVESLGLRRGTQVGDDVVAHIHVLAGQAAAMQIAQRFIAFRPRSVAEVRQRLRRAGIDEATSAAVLDALVAGGTLDDRRFADAWVENRTALSPRSARLMQAELRRKGIDRETVDDSLQQSAETDDVALALEAGRRRARRLAQSDRRAFDMTLGPFLSRRGFSADVTRQALDALWSELTEDEHSL